MKFIHFFDNMADSIFSQTSSSGFNIAAILFIILTMRAIFKLNKTKEVINFFNNKKTIGQLFFILFWCFLIYRFIKTHPAKKDSQKVENIKSSTKKAVVALFIAFFARIDLVIAPFWLVWLISYYLEDWI